MEHISPEICCEALDKLVSTDYEGESHEYEKALERRLNILQYWLEKEEHGGLKSAMEDILQSDDFQWQGASNINVRLSLTVLALLELLRRRLEVTRTSCPPPPPPRAGVPPPPPADELSVRRRRTAARAVQLTVALCVLPALPPGVGVPLEQRSEHAGLLRGAGGALHSDPYQRREAAVLVVRRLLPLTADRSLADAVLTGHVTDLLALLLLVAHAPLAADGRAGMTPARRQHLLRQRQQLAPQVAPLLARLADSAAVRELLLLQRCAALSKPPRRWLHDRATWWIFQYVRRPGGLASVTEGLLQFWGQDRLDEVPLERVQAVAKLLASPHPDLDNEQYFSHLATEVLALLRLPRPARATILRVAGALSAALWQCPAGRRAVQTSLLSPLLEPLSAARPQSASEAELSGGVTAVWQLLVTGSAPDSPCLDGLAPHAAALFQLHAAVRGGVSQLRTPCRELLRRMLGCGRLGDAGQLVDTLLLAEGIGERRRFALGDAGGVRVEPVPPDEADNWLIDDDDVAAAFAALLGDAAAADVVADVFVTLLERMRVVVAAEGGFAAGLSAASPPPSSGDALLVWERRQTEQRRAFRHGLLTLRALAALTDCEKARAGLEDASRLLPVVQTLLETFCSSTEAAAEAAGEDTEAAEPGLLQVETVCLALGVIAGLLGGEASTAPAWTAARRLLPVLERLADRPAGSERVRDMTTDLRRLVLTNGVIQPSDALGKPGHQLKPGQEYKAGQHQQLGQRQKPDQRLNPDKCLNPDQQLKPDPDQKPVQPRKSLITVLDSRDNDALREPTVKCEPAPDLAAAVDSRLSSSGDDGRLGPAVTGEKAPAASSVSSAVPGVSCPTAATATAATATATTATAATAATASAVTTATSGEDYGDGGGDGDDIADSEAGPVTYQRAMYELVDPMLPVRAHALMSLGRLLERRDPEACRHRDRLLTVFQEKLDDDDSYVYLAAVRGLACLADLYTAQVVPVLCRQVSGGGRRAVDTESRLKLAEALVLMVRNLGDMAPHYAPQLVAALLVGCRDGEPLVRASSLSCLAEICRLLRFSVAAHLHEIFGCLSALVDTDPAIEVRRAAVLVISQLIDGLGTDALKVLEDVLLPLYRRLKVLLRREEDPALLHHVHTALDALEVATRHMLFPPAPKTLQKRIMVLQPPS